MPKSGIEQQIIDAMEPTAAEPVIIKKLFLLRL